ncbi:MAG: hypothetical protein CM1200mP29_02280 [Verrucomicrobiota bacterium]|nr:MAG: hypothetical protein CM1200mP29_02280 [Verrucomicrobiota bacterium]
MLRAGPLAVLAKRHRRDTARHQARIDLWKHAQIEPAIVELRVGETARPARQKNRPFPTHIHSPRTEPPSHVAVSLGGLALRAARVEKKVGHRPDFFLQLNADTANRSPSSPAPAIWTKKRSAWPSAVCSLAKGRSTARAWPSRTVSQARLAGSGIPSSRANTFIVPPRQDAKLHLAKAVAHLGQAVDNLVDRAVAAGGDDGPVASRIACAARVPALPGPVVSNSVHSIPSWPSDSRNRRAFSPRAAGLKISAMDGWLMASGLAGGYSPGSGSVLPPLTRNITAMRTARPLVTWSRMVERG